MDTIQPMPYPAVNTMLDDAFPRGALNYWKSAFLTELSDAAVRMIVDGAPVDAEVVNHADGSVEITWSRSPQIEEDDY